MGKYSIWNYTSYNIQFIILSDYEMDNWQTLNDTEQIIQLLIAYGRCHMFLACMQGTWQEWHAQGKQPKYHWQCIEASRLLPNYYQGHVHNSKSLYVHYIDIGHSYTGTQSAVQATLAATCIALHVQPMGSPVLASTGTAMFQYPAHSYHTQHWPCPPPVGSCLWISMRRSH